MLTQNENLRWNTIKTTLTSHSKADISQPAITTKTDTINLNQARLSLWLIFFYVPKSVNVTTEYDIWGCRSAAAAAYFNIKRC